MQRLALLVTLSILAVAVTAHAAEWGLIRPGVSTKDTVRARYGAPSRVDRQKVDNYDTESWIYEGDKQPTGIERLTIEFGLLEGGKYHPDTVRAFRLEPHGSTFNRGIVTNGWGFPDRMARDKGQEIFLYRDGLLVYFDEAGWNAKLLLFTIPQPRDPTEEQRSR